MPFLSSVVPAGSESECILLKPCLFPRTNTFSYMWLCVLPHPCFIACVSVSMSVSVSVCGDATDPLPPPRDYPPPVLVRVVVRAPSLVRLAFTRVRLAVRRAAPAPHLPAGRLPSRPQLAVVPRVCVKWRWAPAKPPHPRRRRGKAAWASSAVRLTLYSRAGIRCVPSLVSRARASAGTRWGTCAAAVEREGGQVLH